jgi:ATP-dependent RNA helicase DeaD
VALSGELSQNERTHALQAMRDGRARVCIATDVAARGIDLPGLELVIHADLPTNPETLLHRSGRTGRAGQKGVSAMIVPLNARRRAERLLENARINATWAKPPSADEVSKRDDERILAEPIFTEAPAEDEVSFIKELLERHGPEQVAAAFLRQYRAGHSAPEDLADVSVYDDRKKVRRDDFSAPREDGPPVRNDFTDGAWVSLSVGRKQNAEPRWLIPMLCRHGNLTKRDIGAIRMQQEETYVELSAEAAERFMAAIGSAGTLEKGIRVKPLEGKPDVSRSGQEAAFVPTKKKSYAKDNAEPALQRKSPRPATRQDASAEQQDRKPWNKKPGKPDFKKPDFAKNDGRPQQGKPAGKKFGGKKRQDG